MMSRARPDNLVLLIDTYDTEAAARKVVALAPRLAAAGITVRSVRLDNGDLIASQHLIPINAGTGPADIANVDDIVGMRRVTAMISLEDRIGLCGLDEEQVAAISEHEHIPEIAAAALASYLLEQPHGGQAIRKMITDDIHKALDEGRIRHAAELFMALRHFLEQNADARIGLAAE